MAVRVDKFKRGTLFDPDFLRRFADFAEKKVPYSIALETFSGLNSQAVPEDEVSIFRHVLEHEICAYEPRGYLYGPLSFIDSRRRRNRLRCMYKPFGIPSFVEPDVLRIAHCDASVLLLVDDVKVFQILIKSTIIDEMQIVLMTSCGIPRLGTRRLIHRLERECNLQVLLLTDNDTWGYWIYSVLKRGLMAPAEKSQYAAIENVSYFGVRARDWKTFAVPIERLRPWESQWDLRLRELRKQRCFRSQNWQMEFNRFVDDRFGLDLRVLVDHLGVGKFVNAFLLPRLMRFLARKGARKGGP